MNSVILCRGRLVDVQGRAVRPELGNPHHIEAIRHQKNLRTIIIGITWTKKRQKNKATKKAEFRVEGFFTCRCLSIISVSGCGPAILKARRDAVKDSPVQCTCGAKWDLKIANRSEKTRFLRATQVLADDFQSHNFRRCNADRPDHASRTNKTA